MASDFSVITVLKKFKWVDKNARKALRARHSYFFVTSLGY